MSEFNSATLLLVAMGVSGLLYFLLAVYKRYAYYWWAIGGIVVCLPIAMLLPKIDKYLKEEDILFSREYVFITIYLFIYVGLWLFAKPSEITEEERKRREKLDEAIFDGFLALKEKRINDAYHIFKKGYLADPDNPVIKTILASFRQGKHGLVKENRFFEWRYKLLLALKRKKEFSSKTTQNQAESKDTPVEEKKIEGQVVE